MDKTFDVWMNGELVGRWTQEPRKGHLFKYAESWLVSPSVRPLSLSLPLGPSSKPLQGPHIEDFLTTSYQIILISDREFNVVLAVNLLPHLIY